MKAVSLLAPLAASAMLIPAGPASAAAAPSAASVQQFARCAVQNYEGAELLVRLEVGGDPGIEGGVGVAGEGEKQHVRRVGRQLVQILCARDGRDFRTSEPS